MMQASLQQHLSKPQIGTAVSTCDSATSSHLLDQVHGSEANPVESASSRNAVDGSTDVANEFGRSFRSRSTRFSTSASLSPSDREKEALLDSCATSSMPPVVQELLPLPSSLIDTMSLTASYTGTTEQPGNDLAPGQPERILTDRPSSTLTDIEDSQETESQRPNRYLPIFAENAMDWVTREIGVSDFNASAQRLAADTLRSERLDRTRPSDRAPEPDYAMATRWSNAFFECSLDVVFGILHRPSFDAKLRESFETGTLGPEDAAWYALRHTVYATGCRIALSVDESSASFSEASTQAWRYYENALAVHTDLLYGKTGLMSVQALILMSFFAEALGSRSLEDILTSNAVRLAQAQGLHLQVTAKSKLTEEDILHRQGIWWCLYSCDKHFAWRSARSSVGSLR